VLVWVCDGQAGRKRSMSTESPAARSRSPLAGSPELPLVSDDDDGNFEESPVKVKRRAAEKKPTAGARGKRAAAAAPTSPGSVDKLANGVAKIPHPLASARLPVPLKQSTPVLAAAASGQASHPDGECSGWNLAEILAARLSLCLFFPIRWLKLGRNIGGLSLPWRFLPFQVAGTWLKYWCPSLSLLFLLFQVA